MARSENKTIRGNVTIIPIEIQGKKYVVKGVRTAGTPHRTVGFVFPPNDPNGRLEKQLDKAVTGDPVANPPLRPDREVSAHYHTDQNGDQILDEVTIIP